MARGRDLSEAARLLEVWLRGRVGSTAIVSALELPSGGLSNDTLLCAATWEGEAHELVVRAEPGPQALFPMPSVVREYEVLVALAGDASVAVPTVRWLERDPDVLGSAFFVMDRVRGQIPADNPPFMLTGFAHDATVSEQAALQRSTIDVLAAIHGVDWRARGLDKLERVPGAKRGLDEEIAYWRAYLDWAEIDGGLAPLRAALDWCVEQRPVVEPDAVLCWGDARYGNIVYAADFTVAAVLDWEMALLGPPELDLGWFLFLSDTALMWMPELPGFAGRDVLIRTYESSLGRSVVDLHWYEVWAGMRAAAIQARIVARANRHDKTIELSSRTDNAVVASLRRLVDLPG